jgi:hypothetical protein
MLTFKKIAQVDQFRLDDVSVNVVMQHLRYYGTYFTDIAILLHEKSKTAK